MSGTASLIQSKQIKKNIASWCNVPSFLYPAFSPTSNVTSVVATSLGTAGNNNSAVELTPSTSELISGVIVTGENNRVEVYRQSNGEKLSFNSQEIYGRITEASGVYSLALYYSNNGVQTSYQLPIATVIKFEFIYRFSFKTLRGDFAVGIITRNITQEVTGGGAARQVVELKTITIVDDVPDLIFTPNIPSNVILSINGKIETSLNVSPSFTIGGVNNKEITWNTINAGYSVDTNDLVIAVYTTLES